MKYYLFELLCKAFYLLLQFNENNFILPLAKYETEKLLFDFVQLFVARIYSHLTKSSWHLPFRSSFCSPVSRDPFIVQCYQRSQTIAYCVLFRQRISIYILILPMVKSCYPRFGLHCVFTWN